MDILDRIKEKMTQENWDAMVSQAEQGDIEWAIDMIAEARDDISPVSVWYLAGYHDVFSEFTDEELNEAQEAWVNRFYNED